MKYFLKYGLDLTLPRKELTIENKKIYIFGCRALDICLDDKITTDALEQITKLNEEYRSHIILVAFKDCSLKDTIAKSNALNTLEQLEVDEVVSV